MIRVLGVVLVLAGFVSLLGGISYNKNQTIAQIGDIKMRATEKRHLALPPLASGLAILIGTTLWFRGGRGPRG